ncbi:MAG: hypothetical protein IKM39_05255 [Clostridia bacterium]|nr:hypothetical protein [Clostridia bacterium]
MRIKSLLSTHTGRIYVYFANEELCRHFLHEAEQEGFTFPDGVKPTARHISRIFTVNRNMTINYVGFVGHIAYQAANRIGNQPLVKIDYRDILC